MTARRGRVVRPITAAIGLVVIVAVAAIIGARVLPHGGAGGAGAAGAAAGPASAGSRAAPAVFGIPTVTSGCPAASVRAAAARCPQSPECWDGLVISSGNATAASLPCGRVHSWETFAIAILPADVRTYDYGLVAANRVVRAVCSMPVLLRSRLGRARQIPERSWEIDVLPPDQTAFDSGARAYRCVAHRLTRPAPRTVQFGR